MSTRPHILVRSDGRLSKVSAWVLIALLSVGAVASVTALWAGSGQEQVLAAEGERWWRTSPDPTNPVACATCHHDPAATRGWAASFPKLRPLPPPHSRVVTLLQANAEAVARHYGLEDPRRAATAITAYLTALGADTIITPGVSAGQPVFAVRMAQLAASVARGERVFARRCESCHRATDVAVRVLAFPRLRKDHPASVESFLEDHHPHAPRLRWDGQEVADLMAALMVRLAGRTLGDPAIVGRKEPS
jgi:cytochrome c553